VVAEHVRAVAARLSQRLAGAPGSA
jgi:hypothetical protein